MALTGLGSTQLNDLSSRLGYSQGGAPSNVLGYQATPANKLSSGLNFDALAAQLKSYYDQQLAQQNALLRQQMAMSYTPYFDIIGKYNQAQSQATGVVNPVYQEYLNQYLAQEQTNKTRAQEDTVKAKEQISQALGDTLTSTGISRQRVGEDVGTNLSNLATQEQNYQQDQGTGFDAARLALLRGQGDVGGGLDAQAQGEQQRQQFQTEGRQQQAFNTQRQAQQLFRTRSFEDLTRQEGIAQRNAGQQTEQQDVNLNRYIEDLAYNEQQKRNELEQQRQGAILAKAQEIYSGLKRDFYSTLSGYGLQNAIKAYGQ